MGGNRYSDGYKPVDVKDCPEAIQQANEELRAHFGATGVTWHYWNTDWVAASITIPVDVPFRGAVNGIDIRREEPLLLVFHKDQYPYRVPGVRSDRKDFPAGQLPHLNPVSPGQPPSFCLHRGSLDDWFAEHGLLDLVNRARGWLRDAAANRLIREDDRFEETRIEESCGVLESDAHAVFSHVTRYWARNGGQGGHAAFLLERKSGGAAPRFRWSHLVSPDKVTEILDLVRRYNEASGKLGKEDRLMLGLLVWPRRSDSCSEYFATLPDHYGDLVGLAGRALCDLESAVSAYEAQELGIFDHVPIALVVRRPKPLIRSGKDMEILHFLAVRESAAQRLSEQPTCPVSVLGHRFPLTVGKARELSMSPARDVPKILLAGCGAVGSKVGLSLARGGYTDLWFCDHDSVSTHNMVRHGLLPDQVGQNKAEALKEQITDMFSDDKHTLSITASATLLQELMFGSDAKKLSSVKFLLDCTASRQALHALTDSRLPSTFRTIRCELADEGRLGLWMMEGAGRNPRVDDLQALLWDSAVDNTMISTWLRQHRQQVERAAGPVMEDIGIGMGCSTTTMRLSDDIISYHAAGFTMAAKEACHSTDPSGLIQATSIAARGRLMTLTHCQIVRRTEVLRVRNKSGWVVRLSRTALSYMKEQLRAAAPHETGGILIGYLHLARKTVYVTRALPAPADSKSSPYMFVRGVADVADTVRTIEQKTGGLLGYVGEWHTHPNGRPEPSGRDLETVSKIKATLDKVGLPFHLMIVNSSGCFSYLY